MRAKPNKIYKYANRLAQNINYGKKIALVKFHDQIFSALYFPTDYTGNGCFAAHRQPQNYQAAIRPRDTQDTFTLTSEYFFFYKNGYTVALISIFCNGYFNELVILETCIYKTIYKS